MIVWSYGGGRQSVGMAVLVAEGGLPRPDFIIMADTSRENPETWDYHHTHVEPYLAKIGLEVRIAPHTLATVDLYAHNGNLLIPAFAETGGKMPAFCSGEWKRDVSMRFARQIGVDDCDNWVGISWDERERVSTGRRKWFRPTYPLVERRITVALLMAVVEKAGLPEPPKSSCWMCPNQRNSQWARLKEKYPDHWKAACEMDEAIRQADEQGGVYLHHSRKPLALADLTSDSEDLPLFVGCKSGSCWT